MVVGARATDCWEGAREMVVGAAVGARDACDGAFDTEVGALETCVGALDTEVGALETWVPAFDGACEGATLLTSVATVLFGLAVVAFETTLGAFVPMFAYDFDFTEPALLTLLGRLSSLSFSAASISGRYTASILFPSKSMTAALK